MAYYRNDIPNEYIIIEEKPYPRRRRSRRGGKVLVESHNDNRHHGYTRENVYVDDGPFGFYVSPTRQRKMKRRSKRRNEDYFIIEESPIRRRRKSRKSRNVQRQREKVYFIEEDARRNHVTSSKDYHYRHSLPSHAENMIVYNGHSETHHRRMVPRTVSVEETLAYNKNEDNEERFISVIAQPPIRTKFKQWQVIGDEPMHLPSPPSDFKEPQIKSSQKQRFVSSSTYEHGNKFVNNEKLNRTVEKSVSRTYQKSSMSSQHGRTNDTSEEEFLKPKINKDNVVPEYASVTKPRIVKKQITDDQTYDRINFEKQEEKLQSSPLLEEIPQTHQQQTNDQISKYVRRESRKSVTATTATTNLERKKSVNNMTTKESSSNHIQSKQNPSSEQSNPLESGHDWATWMDEQRQKSHQTLEQTYQPIPTESISTDRSPNELKVPMGRIRADTGLIEPEEEINTGDHHDYDGPSFFGNWDGEDDAEGEDDVDARNKKEQPTTITNNKQNKPGKVSFLDSIKNTFSPRKTEKKAEKENKENDETSEKNCPVLEFLGEIGDSIAEYLDDHPSPWGRNKIDGSIETCKELKDRIMGRTIFMTGCCANDQHDKDTELNMDRMPEEETYFVSRSVEHNSESENESKKKDDSAKCGKYIKFYCKKCKRWVSGCKHYSGDT